MSQFGPDYVRAIAPYQAGKPISEVAREFGLDEANIVKLASNENPFGVPESAKAAMASSNTKLVPRYAPIAIRSPDRACALASVQAHIWL